MHMLNKERITSIKNEATKAAKAIAPSCELPHFNPKVLNCLDGECIRQLKESIHVYELKWRENAELTVICDMALAYLDTLVAVKEGKIIEKRKRSDVAIRQGE